MGVELFGCGVDVFVGCVGVGVVCVEGVGVECMGVGVCCVVLCVVWVLCL